MQSAPPPPGSGSGALDAGDAIVAEKNRLRAESLARRDALGDDERESGSRAIAERLIGLDLPASVPISAFLPIRSEVDLRPAIARLFAAGHPIGLPVIRKPDLVFRSWTPDAALIPLGFGTYGPAEDAPEVIPEIMLVPLSAFDRQGGRIGYGKAYYDTTIAGLRANGRNPRLIGVAFSVQEAERVPMEAHDVPLQMIVTEREVILPPEA